MDYSTLNHEQFLDQGIAFMSDLHRRIDEHADGAFKSRMDRRAAVIHELLASLWERAGQEGVVRPMDGTDKPPPKP